MRTHYLHITKNNKRLRHLHKAKSHKNSLTSLIGLTPRWWQWFLQTENPNQEQVALLHQLAKRRQWTLLTFCAEQNEELFNFAGFRDGGSTGACMFIRRLIHCCESEDVTVWPKIIELLYVCFYLAFSRRIVVWILQIGNPAQENIG